MTQYSLDSPIPNCMITQYHHSSCTGPVLARLNSIIIYSHENSVSGSGLVILTYISPSFSSWGLFPSVRARLGEFEDEEGEGSVEEEDCGETEVADALANVPAVPQGSNLALTNQPLVSQSDSSLLKIMEQMATIMGQLPQSAAPGTIPKPLHSRLHQ
ncbi:hypothetical protein O181_052265 [Austropuccinia psidii MF-1]|uniref:Uncharacterized protein n=1 Tax=Austropuccinia psidii MF-1 TaxID=1389203 RepID=A0A9Q3DYJ5_9BASI|nr:hypothetical protein [Austropuccinia psidii MF-1]